MTTDLPLIVIIDDDLSFREAMEGLIGSFGLRAKSFESAITFLRSNEPIQASCLIVDVNMPVMSGLELQERLAVAQPNLPVIFVSGAGMQSVRSRALAAGAVAFFDKPLDAERLHAAILSARLSSAPPCA